MIRNSRAQGTTTSTPTKQPARAGCWVHTSLSFPSLKGHRYLASTEKEEFYLCFSRLGHSEFLLRAMGPSLTGQPCCEDRFDITWCSLAQRCFIDGMLARSGWSRGTRCHTLWLFLPPSRLAPKKSNCSQGFHMEVPQLLTFILVDHTCCLTVIFPFFLERDV